MFGMGSFVEPGTLEVYFGPMKSEKSFHLISRLLSVERAQKKALAFKPSDDTRTPELYSRCGDIHYPCSIVSADSLEGVIEQSSGMDVVGFDEAQFFSKKIVPVVEELLYQNIHVIVAGLNLDFRGEIFGSMAELIARAHMPYNLVANCDLNGCDKPAVRSQRLYGGNPVSYFDDVKRTEEFVESDFSYEARCFKHHVVPDKPRNF